MNRMIVMRNEDGLFVERELEYHPLNWQRQGLQQTATGYGMKLTSPYKIKFADKLRRVYYGTYSNVCSYFVRVKDEDVFLGI